MKKLGMAALTALMLAGSLAAMTGTAEARWGGRGGWHGGYHRGYGGYGIGLGIASGLALGGAYGYGYGYGNPYYGNCWIRNRVFFDQWGRRYIRPVRVCG